jgi:hypothetical protein
MNRLSATLISATLSLRQIVAGGPSEARRRAGHERHQTTNRPVPTKDTQPINDREAAANEMGAQAIAYDNDLVLC